MLKEKIRKFIRSKNTNMKRLCERWNVHQTNFTNILKAGVSPPKRMWGHIIQDTEGEITLADILDAKLKDIEFLEVREGDTAVDCKVFINLSKATEKAVEEK